MRFKAFTRAIALTLTSAIAAACLLGACENNSKNECRPICEWWQSYCTTGSFEQCMNDCQEASEDAADIQTRCVGGVGWVTPTSCRNASCCVRFVYDRDFYDEHC